MKEQEAIEVIKSSGDKMKFSLSKLRRSLQRSGAEDALVEQIVDQVRDELYQGISTREIYNRAFALLKKNKSVLASKYKLKKAIYELGPTGFPFEKFVAAILRYSGYTTEVGKVLQGHCVSHEVDVLARKNGLIAVIECKFHSDEGRNCNVKIPLYINSRYNDIKQHWERKSHDNGELDKGWVVTNTRFTEDALAYGKCVDLFLLSWDVPHGDGLRDRIDRLGLYPITVSTLLSQREKQFLLSRDIVLCRELLNDSFFLDHLEVKEPRKKRIMKELHQLCGC
ncbi:ATP cone domain-containing protein [Maribacter polysaccharolyticus]|uniref:ATP cone domain-containing protein n=1 Tax=Maribacter polysaccharolyticus TaxID=3020831 RepID=UPI00237EF4E6|nr:ATP cone domain-containing protein [Maribacter polysaccharolyticus]MDE3740835.1 ATP cone domain-containing protein [Maribacter polysaccharolyticus]